MNNTIKIHDDVNETAKKEVLNRIESKIKHQLKTKPDHESYAHELRRIADDVVLEHNMHADIFMKVGADLAIDENNQTALVLCCGQITIEGAMEFLHSEGAIQGVY